MKKISILLAVILPTMAVQAKDLRSKSMKQQICNALYNDYYNLGVQKAPCLRDSFEIVEPVVSKKIEGDKRKLTTLMTVIADTADIKFKVTLTASLTVDTDGNIKRKGWEVAQLVPETLSSEAILKNSWPHSSNVTELENAAKEIPKDVYKRLEAYIPDTNVDRSASDFEENFRSYYKILNPDTKKVIGYIFDQFFASEEFDMKEQVTIKFNLKGDFFDSEAESWGYHE